MLETLDNRMSHDNIRCHDLNLVDACRIAALYDASCLIKIFDINDDGLVSSDHDKNVFVLLPQKLDQRHFRLLLGEGDVFFHSSLIVSRLRR